MHFIHCLHKADFKALEDKDISLLLLTNPKRSKLMIC